MVTFLWILFALLVAQFLFVVVNVADYPTWDRTDSGLNKEALPSVSVLIPARNEAERLPDLLESLLQQTHRPMEVLVLNDQSTDETEQIVKQVEAEHSWVSVMKGHPLPAGWLGKPYACDQLGRVAKGDWFLFLDADVRLHPTAIERALLEARKQKTGLITGFPKQIVRTWLEKLVVPLMVFTIACHLPIRQVRASRRAQFVAAHGGFLLIEKGCYETIGGHQTLQKAMVDDMALAKRVKQEGFPVTLAKLDKWVWMRMYTSAKEVFRGYQKNIFAGMNYNLFLLAFVLVLYSVLYVFPGIFFLVTWGLGRPTWVALATFLMGILIKGWIDQAHGQPFWYGFFLPFSMLALIVIAFASVYGSFSKKGYEWKGRRYT